MAGRPKQKLYHYDLNGKRLGTFLSMSEVHNKYYKGEKYPLFKNKRVPTMHLLPDATVIFKEVTYRDDVVKLVNRLDNPLWINTDKKYIPIEVFNLDNIKIAEYYSIGVAAKLMNVPQSSIHSIMRHKGKEAPKNKLGILIKFKN